MASEDMGFGGWIWAFLIIALIFNGGMFGGNAGGEALSNQIATGFNNQQLNQIALSSANNNYETARLISEQNISMMSQNNTNLINAIQGFNAVNQNISAQGSDIRSSIAALNANLNECCCSIKTMLLENRLQDTQIALQNAQNIAVNAEQSQYLLGVMGKWVANPSATA